MQVKSQVQYDLFRDALRSKERGFPSRVRETVEQLREALEGVCRESLPERVTPPNPEVEIVNKYGEWIKFEYKPYHRIARITGVFSRGQAIDFNMDRTGLEELKAWLNATFAPARAAKRKRAD
jgi:hypothetical protein